MANPNIVNVNSITGQTALANATSVLANIVTNSASSGSVLKLNTVTLANFSTSNVYCNVIINRTGVGSYYQLGNALIPAQSTMVVVGRDTPIYLLEGDVIQSNVSANGAVTITASYEQIS